MHGTLGGGGAEDPAELGVWSHAEWAVEPSAPWQHVMGAWASGPFTAPVTAKLTKRYHELFLLSPFLTCLPPVLSQIPISRNHPFSPFHCWNQSDCKHLLAAGKHTVNLTPIVSTRTRSLKDFYWDNMNVTMPHQKVNCSHAWQSGINKLIITEM